MKKLLLLLVPFFFLTISCQDEELMMEAQNEDSTELNAIEIDDGSELAMDAALKDVIGTFSSVVLNNPDMIELIRTEALKKFDDDYDVLFETIRDMQITDAKSGVSGTFMEHLNTEFKSKSGISIDLESKIKKIPDFNIYVHNAETKSDKVLMMAIPYDRDDMDTYEYVAYDKNGKKYILDATDDGPDYTVIVLGVNERVGIEEYLLTDKQVEERTARNAVKGVYNHRQILKNFKVIQDKERWGQGGAEVYAMYAIGYETFFSCKQFYRSNCKPGTYTFNLPIWDCPSLPQFGWTRIEFWEKDGNQRTTWGVQGNLDLFTGTKIPCKATFQIDNIGWVKDDLFGKNAICIEEKNEVTGFGTLTAQFDWSGTPINWTLWGLPFYNDGVYGEWQGWEWDDGAANGSFEDYYNDPEANDITPPSKPGGLQAIDVTYFTAQIIWSASNDDYIVSKYDVYLDGIAVGETSSLHFELWNLDPGRYYTISVIARDAAGNSSPAAMINFATASSGG